MIIKLNLNPIPHLKHNPHLNLNPYPDLDLRSNSNPKPKLNPNPNLTILCRLMRIRILVFHSPNSKAGF